jgi:hypothetical protein
VKIVVAKRALGFDGKTPIDQDNPSPSRHVAMDKLQISVIKFAQEATTQITRKLNGGDESKDKVVIILGAQILSVCGQLEGSEQYCEEKRQPAHAAAMDYLFYDGGRPKKWHDCKTTKAKPSSRFAPDFTMVKECARVLYWRKTRRKCPSSPPP